ncbi:MAG TPA: YciI family protein [Polyangiaceae bacterium]|nr:YciI family protein [Polyangiaceae bacterium]
MLYAILCYDSENVVASWTKEQDDAAMAKLDVAQQKLAAQGKLGPVARLMPTHRARTLRKGREALVMDGPFAETKEQLLGFFVVDCATPQEALDAAHELAKASSSEGAYEIRPIAVFRPGSAGG